MARRKKTALQKLIGDFSVSGMLLHPAALFVGFNLLLFVTAIWAWGKYQHQIVPRTETGLTYDKLRINPPPAWIPEGKQQLADAVYNRRDPQTVSIFEPNLVGNTANSLKTFGWIRDIRKIEKSRDGMTVELDYRTPLAVVELNSQTQPNWKGPNLIPVDHQSCVLPQNARTAENPEKPLPRIYLFRPIGNSSQLLTWTRWPEDRVQLATSISHVLANDWHAMGLYRVVSWRHPEFPDTAMEPFELWTREGENATRVFWGNPPGHEAANEAKWQQKIVALREYVEKNGPLNTTGDRIIDLRSGNAVRTQRAAAAPKSRPELTIK